MTTSESPDTPRSYVDLTPVINDALKQVDAYREADPVYAELMATYAELGEVLQSTTDDTTEDECNSLVGVLIALGRRIDLEAEQEWARWCLHNMNMDGVA